ncbi:uncharacterized protein LOC124418291 [Gallus gallus]|uniref:uncharacterized protein LOC124418291 n=1 Tax=Gallus gallus TaxID=9031 RepID=UPI001F017596|nr:uncharacterized protein LOC124418291 [Gallus gallus]
MRQCRAEGLAAVLPPAGLGLRGSRAALPSVRPGSVRPHASLSLFCMKFQWEKMDFVSLLLLIFSAVAVSRAQVQQEPSAETSEGTGINITCSHPNIQTSEYIHWYRQLPGRGPAFLVSTVKGLQEGAGPGGVAVGVGRPALQRPVARPAPSRGRGGVLLRRGPTGRRAAAAAGHEPLWAGRGHSAVRARRGRCRFFPPGPARAGVADMEHVPRTARHPPEYGVPAAHLPEHGMSRSQTPSSGPRSG